MGESSPAGPSCELAACASGGGHSGGLVVVLVVVVVVGGVQVCAPAERRKHIWPTCVKMTKISRLTHRIGIGRRIYRRCRKWPPRTSTWVAPCQSGKGQSLYGANRNSMGKGIFLPCSPKAGGVGVAVGENVRADGGQFAGFGAVRGPKGRRRAVGSAIAAGGGFLRKASPHLHFEI